MAYTLTDFQHQIENGLNNIKYNNTPSELYDPIKYILSLGGKRMRPVLVLASSNMFSDEIDVAVAPALGIELFHNFTLLHDDIMDKAPLRRGSATVHEKWNTNIAILSGDTMFVKSYQLVQQAPDRVLRQVLKLFSETAIEVCEGQQMDMNFETIQQVNIITYLKMIELKTAVLLACCLKMGALLGGASEEDAQHLYEFGRNIGIAFQLQDDLLDVYGDAKSFGKQVGGDIVSNKKTFLLIKALSVAHKYQKEELEQWMALTTFNTQEKVKAVTEIYDYLNIRTLAENEIRKYYEKSMLHLEKVNVSAEKKQLINSFADQLMVRKV